MSLKIVYVIPGLKYSGGIIHVLEEAKEMKKRGHNITIFTPYSDLNKFPYYRELSNDFKFIHGVYPDLSYLPSIMDPFRLIRSLVSIRKMAYTLAESLDSDLDLVVGDFYWTIFGASLSRERGARCKIVLKIQGPPQEEIKNAVGSPFSFLCHKAVSKADAITTVSCGVSRSIKSYFDRESTNIGNGIRDIFFKKVELSKKEELLKKLDIKGRKIALYVGRLNRGKGIELLLKVMDRLKRYNTILLIAGDGEREYYEKMARRMGLSKYIRWLGEISSSQLPSIYQLANVFIFPSWYEGFGLPPLEAMASGLPVVLTETEGAREYAQSGDNCIMTKSGDIEGLFKGVVSILEDIDMGRKFGENGRETAKTFSWKSVADRAERFYYKLIDK